MGGTLGDVFDADGVTWTPISPGLAKVRRLITTLLNLLGAAAFAALAVFFTPWLWIGVVVLLLTWVWEWWLIGRQVRAWGYAERADDLLIRHGVMFRVLVVVLRAGCSSSTWRPARSIGCSMWRTSSCTPPRPVPMPGSPA